MIQTHMLMLCRFDDALLELLSTSLMTKDPEASDISVHRLIQEKYREYLAPSDEVTYQSVTPGNKQSTAADGDRPTTQRTHDKLYLCFTSAAELLVHFFPEQNQGRLLRPQFGLCKKYAGHVIALCDRSEQFHFKARAKGDMESFCRLAQSCAWYIPPRFFFL